MGNTRYHVVSGKLNLVFSRHATLAAARAALRAVQKRHPSVTYRIRDTKDGCFVAAKRGQ